MKGGHGLEIAVTMDNLREDLMRFWSYESFNILDYFVAPAFCLIPVSTIMLDKEI